MTKQPTNAAQIAGQLSEPYKGFILALGRGEQINSDQQSIELERMGLIVSIVNGRFRDNTLTDLGRAVLAHLDTDATEAAAAGGEDTEALDTIWENHQMAESIGVSYDVYVEQETDKGNDPVPLDEWLIKVISGMTKQVTSQQATIARLEAEGFQQSRALDTVSTEWVQLHMALSEALGLEFLPNEDIERYTEAISSMKAALTAANEREKGLKELCGRAAHELDFATYGQPRPKSTINLVQELSKVAK